MSIVPTLGPGGSDPWRRHGNTLLFARWLSTVFMSLEQLGEPHPCQAAGNPSWAWINPSSHVSRPQPTTTVPAAEPPGTAQQSQSPRASTSSTSPNLESSSSRPQQTSVDEQQTASQSSTVGAAQNLAGVSQQDSGSVSRSAAASSGTEAEAAGMAEFVRFALQHARSQLDGSVETPEPSSEALRSVDLDGPMLHGLPWREPAHTSPPAAEQVCTRHQLPTVRAVLIGPSLKNVNILMSRPCRQFPAFLPFFHGIPHSF